MGLLLYTSWRGTEDQLGCLELYNIIMKQGPILPPSKPLHIPRRQPPSLHNSILGIHMRSRSNPQPTSPVPRGNRRIEPHQFAVLGHVTDDSHGDEAGFWEGGLEVQGLFGDIGSCLGGHRGRGRVEGKLVQGRRWGQVRLHDGLLCGR